MIKKKVILINFHVFLVAEIKFKVNFFVYQNESLVEVDYLEEGQLQSIKAN